MAVPRPHHALRSLFFSFFSFSWACDIFCYFKGMTTAAPLVRVIVPLALGRALDYAWPHDAPPPAVGDVVQVVVGRQEVPGVVVALLTHSAFDTLKTATPVLGLRLPAAHTEFIQWVARYNFGSPGDGWRSTLVGGAIPTPHKPLMGWRLKDKPTQRLTKKREAVHQAVSKCLLTTAALCEAAHVTPAVVTAMRDAGWLEQVPLPPDVTPLPPPLPLPLPLTEAQELAASALVAAVQHHAFWPVLLDGVTGSGKTEVYFAAIADLLQQPQGQALVLVPEISLTPQWLRRFEERFGFKPAVWHSATAAGAKAATWWGVLEGTTRVVVGARSALFLPFVDLRLMVVDEEHDPSYKQEEGGLIYHARDMAVVRAKLEHCPIVLASATPALETWQNTLAGRFHKLDLPNRFGGATLPRVQRVNLLKDKPEKADCSLSPSLLAAMEATLAKGEQTLLFLNRRGFAPLLICRRCAHRYDCPRCTASLVVHGQHLQCHHCGFEKPFPDVCAQCGSDNLHAFGPGTRKVAQEVTRHFPQARVAIADRDSITTVSDMAALVHQLEQGQVDVLVGTQMVAKGHHFPQLTLVGVVDADMGLAQGDLRAAEKTFQLITQVAGRAGRGLAPGQVLIQTHTPEHPLFEAIAALDRDRFYALELQSRQRTGMPPFSRLTALVVSSPQEAQAQQAAQRLAMNFPLTEGYRLLGPAPAPLRKLRDQYRFRLLVISQQAPQGLLQGWLQSTPWPKNVTVRVDIDPQSFL